MTQQPHYWGIHTEETIMQNNTCTLMFTAAQFTIAYLTFNILTLKEKRNRKSRGYITKLGFDQHPDSNNAGKSYVTAHLESQLGKGPRQRICSVDETSENAVLFWFIIPGCKLISSSICEQITALVSC